MDTTPPRPARTLQPGRETRRAIGPDRPALARRRRLVLALLALVVDGAASGPATGVVAGPLGALVLVACCLTAAELARRLACREGLTWAAGLTALSALFLPLGSRAAVALTLAAGTLLVRSRQTHHLGRRTRRRWGALAALAGAVAFTPPGLWLIGLATLVLLVAPVPPSRPGGAVPRRRAAPGAPVSENERPAVG